MRTMTEVDVESNFAASNALLLLIISIVLVNHVLVYKVLRKARRSSGLPSRVKHLTIVLLAYGDIFAALFSLEIRFQSMLSEAVMEGTPCWEKLLSHTYLFHLLPFIHAVGIIVLVAESFNFWRPPISSRDFSLGLIYRRSLVVGLFPWILGVVVILPMVFSGFDFSECTVVYEAPQVKFFYLVTVIIPGILVLAANCWYMQIPITNECLVPRLSLPRIKETEKSTMLYSSDDINKLGTKLSSEVENDDQLLADLKDTKRFSRTPFTLLNRVWNSGKQDFDAKLDNKDSINILLQKDLESSHTTIVPKNMLAAMAKEKRSCLVAGLVYCVCSMPCAILSLVVLFNDINALFNDSNAWPNSVELIATLEFFFRLFVLRSLISPIVWLFDYS